MQFVAMKTDVFGFASRSKAKAKPKRRTLVCLSTKSVVICGRSWTDIQSEIFAFIDYLVSKRLSTLCRHGHLLREDDGATEFWRLKDYLRNEFEIFDIGLMKCRRVKWHGAEATGKDFNIVLIYQDKFISEVSKVIQDAFTLIVNCRIIFQCRTISSSALSHRMCNQEIFHHKFRIDNGRPKFEQKPYGILHNCGSYEKRTQGSEKH